jgi:hypothetical protein
MKKERLAHAQCTVLASALSRRQELARDDNP